MRWMLAAVVVPLLGGCVNGIDKYVVKNPIGETLQVPDPDLACRSANGSIPMVAGISPRAHRSLAITFITSAVCSEQEAMRAELQAEQAMQQFEGEQRKVLVSDARERERRHRAVTARRLWTAVGHVEALYGPIGGEECPKLKRAEDELTWFLGLVAGASALLQDQAGGSEVGVPTDILGRVGRGAACLDADTWWQAPAAIQAGSWAMVPGTAPEGVDPWARLNEVAAAGDATGMRLARGLQIQIAANAGRDEDVAAGLGTMATPTEPDPAYALLDAYARMTIRHQQDLLWVKARGYPARDPGQLPGDATESGGPDPFSEDPFAESGGDPFAEPDTDAPLSPDEENPQ